MSEETVLNYLVKAVGYRRGRFLHRIVIYFKRRYRIDPEFQIELNSIFDKRGKYKHKSIMSPEAYGELWGGRYFFIVNKMTYTYTDWEKLESKLVEIKLFAHNIKFIDENKMDLNTLFDTIRPDS